MYYVYFLQSKKNRKVYVGVTKKDPKERLLEHNSGSNRFTSQNSPFDLVYYETHHCSKDARLREKFYKSGFGRKIRDIVIKYTLLGL